MNILARGKLSVHKYKSVVPWNSLGLFNLFFSSLSNQTRSIPINIFWILRISSKTDTLTLWPVSTSYSYTHIHTHTYPLFYIPTTADVLIFINLLHTDDHSRVLLSSIEGVPGSDYINANYIDVSVEKQNECNNLAVYIPPTYSNVQDMITRCFLF